MGHQLQTFCHRGKYRLKSNAWSSRPSATQSISPRTSNKQRPITMSTSSLVNTPMSPRAAASPSSRQRDFPRGQDRKRSHLHDQKTGMNESFPKSHLESLWAPWRVEYFSAEHQAGSDFLSEAARSR